MYIYIWVGIYSILPLYASKHIPNMSTENKYDDDTITRVEPTTHLHSHWKKSIYASYVDIVTILIFTHLYSYVLLTARALTS